MSRVTGCIILLSSCKYAIIVTEGVYDAYLLGAVTLTLENYDIAMFSHAGEIYEYLWECFTTNGYGRGCIAVYPAGGIDNVGNAAEKIANVVRGLISSVPDKEVCLIAIVDSDNDKPFDRARYYYEELQKAIRAIIASDRRDRGARPVQQGGKYFVSLCIRQPDIPKMCVASWKCSAECWIALVVPGSPITSVEYCDENVRKRCHEIVEGELPRDVREAGVVAVVEKVKHLIDNADPAWRAMLRELIAGIRDGSEEAGLEPSTARLG